jgi:hydrogenase nickel incorporation protein HypB
MIVAVTEGEDKPLKYPTIFNTADLAVLSKINLAKA